MWWSHLPVAFVRDITVALTAAPVSSSGVSISSLVVNRRRVLQLGEPTGDSLLVWEEWAEREIAHLRLWGQCSPQELVECLLCTRCLVMHWGQSGVKCSLALLRREETEIPTDGNSE